MRFNESQYVEDFIKKVRKAPALPDDLLSRYNISLPATDTEIVEHMRAVRAYWNRIYQGSSTAAQVARMCLAADERLRDQHGSAMQTRAWWEARRAEHESAVRASVDILAYELRQRYGHLGIVTVGIVDHFASKLDLSPSESIQAADEAGVTVIESIALPESEPIQNFSALQRSMAECAALSIPSLIHPGAEPFSLIDRYISSSDARKCLDAAAIDRQISETDKLGVSTTVIARRNALVLLRQALKDGADLRQIALYHLVTIGQEFVTLSPSIAADRLVKTGLSRADAALITVVLDERNSARGVTRSGTVRQSEWLAVMSNTSHRGREVLDQATIHPISSSLSVRPSESPIPIAALQISGSLGGGVGKPSMAAIAIGPAWQAENPPTMHGRLELGVPTALPITPSELTSDKNLANAVSSREDFSFCLIRITPTFHEGQGGTIVQAYVEVKLEVRENHGMPPKVWSMNPDSVEDKTNRSRQVAGSGGGGPAKASVGFDVSYDRYEPFIVAYGLQSSSAYWKFTKTRGREIRGSHSLELIACIPSGYFAEAIIQIYGMTRKRRFGLVPVLADVDNESCRISLPSNVIARMTVLPG